MKPFQAVLAEKTKRGPTIHRSSLIFPARPLGAPEATISLSNHFRIKRGINLVALRLTGYDADGRRCATATSELSESRVYRYDLPLGDAVTWEGEFFSAHDLGMPYPAVMVNHAGPGWHNQVHAYSRVLNDDFEDEAINAVHVAETAIDCRVDAQHDTFVSLLTGPAGLADPVARLGLRLPDGTLHQAEAPFAGGRFRPSDLLLSRLFPRLPIPFGSVLTVETPRQPRFFARAIGGIVKRADGAFSANHTYYDLSRSEEYVSAPHAYGIYPLMRGVAMALVFYPVIAPSSLDLAVEYIDAAGRSWAGPRARLESPHGGTVILDCSDAGEATACRVTASAVESSRLPARISHQIVLHRGGLPGSISESLEIPTGQAQDAPPERPFLAWIQGVVGPRTSTRIALAPMRHAPTVNTIVDLTIYGESGLVREWSLSCAPGTGIEFDLAELAGHRGDATGYYFIYARSRTSRLKMLSLIESLETGHCSAEHNF